MGDPAITRFDRFCAALFDTMKLAKQGIPVAVRYQRLRPALTDIYDFPPIGAGAVGFTRSRRGERTGIMNLFVELTVATYVSRFDGSAGEHFQVLQSLFGEVWAPNFALQCEFWVGYAGEQAPLVEVLATEQTLLTQSRRAIPSVLSISLVPRKAGSCIGVKREFGDIGRSHIRYKAASEALGLIARLAEA